MTTAQIKKYNAKLMKQVDLPYFKPILRYPGLIDLTSIDRQENYESRIAEYNARQQILSEVKIISK